MLRRCFASKKCSACSKVSYCCKIHQRIDWKQHKLTCVTATDHSNNIEAGNSVGISANSSGTDILWPEFELVVEAEEVENAEGLNSEPSASDSNSIQAAIYAAISGAGDTSSSTHVWEDAGTHFHVLFDGSFWSFLSHKI